MLVLVLGRPSDDPSLMAQNEVYNFLKSQPFADPPVVAIMPWPGEYRFPGGRQQSHEPSPLHTGVRHVQELLPGMAGKGAGGDAAVDISHVHATLSRKTISKS